MNRSKILLVEDSEDDIVLTKRALEKAKIANELVVARDGEEALLYLRGEGPYKDKAPDDLPAVVLLDLNMPRMSGFQFLKELRSDERLRLLPVVVLTSSREERDVLESYSLGANSYVQKPVSFDEFAESVKTLSTYWLLLNVAPDRGL
ncbi:MAG: response regulator [Candidatus Thorarchaeota archaeon]